MCVPAVPELAVSAPIADARIDLVTVDGLAYEVAMPGVGLANTWQAQPDGSIARTAGFDGAGTQSRFRLVRIMRDGELRVDDLGATEAGAFTAGFGVTPDGTLLALTIRDGVTHLVRLD